MNIADPLSRLCIISDCKKTSDDEHVNQIVENAKPCAISMAEIKMHSEQDSEIRKVKQGKTPTKLFYKRQNLETKIKNKKREEKNTETKEERHRMWI
ncbi:unnamed protein product [Leptosia nina]|uniref:Uncharacterized protein n=1 Tax=Leptosia nina TaxID=320188 RepID=A0AAV1JDI2_9NEOP